MKVLVVDDIAAAREVLRRELEAGFDTILEAGNGFEALELLRAHAPELVLLDVTLPEMDGLSCLSQLVASQPGVRVLMISALSDAEMVIEAAERGAAGYLFKPFTPAELKAAVAGVVG